MDFAIVVTERCYLRPYTLEDAEVIVQEGNNVNVSKYMTNRFPSPCTRAETEAWLRISTKRLPVRNFAICKHDGTYIGGIGLSPHSDVESRTMDIGYWLGEAYWNQGLATEVARAFSRWTFETMPEIQRLEAGVFGGNEASARVLTKAGYTLEGIRRNAGFKFGKPFDVRMLGMLREECPGLKENEKEEE